MISNSSCGFLVCPFFTNYQNSFGEVSILYIYYHMDVLKFPSKNVIPCHDISR